jgi:hypothetical protein
MTARKTWANGERLTAADLNSMFDAAIARIEGFVADNLAAGVTTNAGRYTAAATGLYIRSPIAGRDGAIVGLAWRKSAALTAGTLDVQTSIAGAAGVSAIVLDSASGNSGFVELGTPRAFSAGNSLSIDFVTSAGFLPAGSIDIAVDLLVEFNRP